MSNGTDAPPPDPTGSGTGPLDVATEHDDASERGRTANRWASTKATAPDGAPDRHRRGSRFRKRLAAVAVVAAIALAATGAGWWFGVRHDDTTANAANATTGAMTMADEVVSVTKGDLAQTVSAEGTVAAASTDDLSVGSDRKSVV